MTIAPYLDRLSAPPPVQAVRVKGRAVRGKDGAETDAEIEIEIKTSARRYRLWVEHKRVRLTAIAATALQAAADASIVMAPVITGEAATRLAERAINYVDLAGNCHLHLGDDVDVHVEGHRAPRVAPEDRGIRAAGYQALFTYLAGADLAAPVRVIDKLAGVSRQAAHQMRTRLIAEGFVLEVRDSLRWNARRRDDALRRWLEGYVAAVRPRLLIGTYRPRARTPDELERVLTTHAGPPGARWRWGGSAAAYALRGHYRGERTVVHVHDDADAFVHRLPAIPDPAGNLVLLRSFGTINWNDDFGGTTVDPLLVYSELLVGDDERAREAATDLLENLVRARWKP